MSGWGAGPISWLDAGQNRESGGRASERTDYATAEQGDRGDATGSGPAT